MLRGAAIQAPEVEKKGRACKFVPVSGVYSHLFVLLQDAGGTAWPVCRISEFFLVLLCLPRPRTYTKERIRVERRWKPSKEANLV